MPGLLIKNLPEPLHRKLKERAARNRRSMTKEALYLLEIVLEQESTQPNEMQTPFQGQFPITDEWLDNAKREGRA
jgi:plasmid stability protein